MSGPGVGIFPIALPAGAIDASLESPTGQFDYLAAMFEANDAQNPAPPTGTPPYGEAVQTDEFLSDAYLAESYMPDADVEAAAAADTLSEVTDPFPAQYPHPYWENDDQYHGLGVPPGVENLAQPVEYGGSQAVPENPAAVHGWDAWSGRVPVARVARHENNFPSYGRGVHRRMGDFAVEKLTMPLVLQTQQYRDLMLVELKRRGVHSAVVTDVPSVPYAETVVQINPAAMVAEEPIGPEGVLP